VHDDLGLDAVECAANRFGVAHVYAQIIREHRGDVCLDEKSARLRIKGQAGDLVPTLGQP
jgi:hypothetical protein